MKYTGILAGCFFACSLWADSETAIQLYRPFTETTKHKPLVVIDKKQGECVEVSKLAKREDAWRCRAEGQWHDPCFSQPYRSQNFVLCPESPWTGRSLKIMLEGPLKKNEQALDMSKDLPWALQLMNGEMCLAVDSTAQYDGLKVQYHCNKKTKLVGHIQRCKPVWSIVSTNNQSGLEEVEIKKAWF